MVFNNYSASSSLKDNLQQGVGGFNNAAPAHSVSATTGDTSPWETPNILCSLNLSEKYIKVFSALRGGNHPYLEKYKAYFPVIG